MKEKEQNTNVKTIRIVSCGYKYGPPPEDAALVIDCRGLINPHYVLKLRSKTGASKAVADYLLADYEVRALMDTLPQLLAALLPGLITRSQYHQAVKLVFACTGGKHRSRFFAISAATVTRQIIAEHPQWSARVVINHRDQGRE